MLCLCYLLCLALGVSSAVYSNPCEYYSKKFLETYGSNGSIHEADLQRLIVDLEAHKQPNEQKIVYDTRINCSDPSMTDHEDCLYPRCLSSKIIAGIYKLPRGVVTDTEKLRDICPALLYQVQNSHDCAAYQNRTHGVASKPENKGERMEKVWGYGFLFMTIVNASSLAGVMILPFIKRPFFKWLLQFLISLAVGTLSSCAVFFLIPDAFAMLEHDPKQDYVWKSAVVMAGIFLFFNVERLLKMGMQHKKSKKEKKIAMTTFVDADNNMDDSKPPLTPQKDKLLNENELMSGNDDSSKDSETGSNGKKKRKIAPVAWMIIVGDTLHRLVDGMSVGAAFALNVFSGISLAVAILCEEFPHGLGDFAMLLKAGMSRKQAVFYNLLAAVGGYIGFVLGVTIGEDVSASRWVFAVAAGMFLYVGLVDMLNDVNQASDEDEEFRDRKFFVYMLQNLGIVIGSVSMLVLAVYTNDISFD